jgi:beta-lactamase class A
MKHRLEVLKRWAISHRALLTRIGLSAVGVLVLVQLFYPGDRMAPFANIDGVSVGGMTKSEATRTLDDQAKKQRLVIALGSVNERFDEPLPADIGLVVSNKDRVENASYPWLLRILPTSLLWYGAIWSESMPTYKSDKAKAASYVTAKFGQDCLVPAKDATLKLNGATLQVVESSAGGDCQADAAVDTLQNAKPRLNQVARVSIPATVIAPVGGDDDARKLANLLNRTSKNGIKLKVADKTQTIEQKEVLSWLTFKPTDDTLTYEINADKANAYLAKTATPLISKPAGVTKVTTSDFTETSRLDGATGQTLNLAATLTTIKRVLDDEASGAQAQVASLAPRVDYTRTYTKTSTGIAAQMRFYDEDNAGVFGVAFAELGGRGLSATHNGDRQFVTASTYKLFVAFSTIKRVEASQMKWDDANIAGGRDLAKCFDDMIVKSDNACAEALIKKIGGKALNEDIRSLGLTNTAFRADNNVTTANDLSKYLTQLERGSMPIKPENRDRLLGAMKRNVYRQGVPAGASGQVADKVGFLWGLLHDATIVYSPKGTYVLVVLTDGSSWAGIADLTRKIEALR